MGDSHAPLSKLVSYVRNLDDSALRSKILLGPLQRENVAAAVQCMADGGVVLFYSQATYGLATNALSQVGVERVYAIKGREFTKPLAMLSSAEAYRQWVVVPPDFAAVVSGLVDKYWPGDLTIILPKRWGRDGAPLFPDHATAGFPSAALMCMDDAACALVAAASFPIAATSANFSGQRSITDPIDGIEQLGGQVDALLLGAPSSVGVNTSIVDLSVSPPRMLRDGKVGYDELRPLLPGLVAA